MVVANSPLHSSKSNMFIERMTQSEQELVRTWRSSLEAKWSVKLDVVKGMTTTCRDCRMDYVEG